MTSDKYDPIPPFYATPVDPPAGYGHSLTIDEIVGRLIGYEPQEMPYDEVLDAAIEQAGFEHHKAETAGATADRLQTLQARINHLGLRRRGAIAFDRELKEAAEGRPIEHLILSTRKYADGLPRFLMSSVYNWARENHERDIPDWAPVTSDRADADSPSSTPFRAESDESLPRRNNLADWDGVILNFRAHKKLRMSLADGKTNTVDLEQIGLLDRTSKELNTAGTALLGLANASAIPKKRRRTDPGISAKVMSELRSSLRQLAQNDSDPFLEYNPADGWRPRFRVNDRRNAGDERTKEKAKLVSYQDGVHGATGHDQYTFESEDPEDQAAEFLAKHDR